MGVLLSKDRSLLENSHAGGSFSVSELCSLTCFLKTLREPKTR